MTGGLLHLGLLFTWITRVSQLPNDCFTTGAYHNCSSGKMRTDNSVNKDDLVNLTDPKRNELFQPDLVGDVFHKADVVNVAKRDPVLTQPKEATKNSLSLPNEETSDIQDSESELLEAQQNQSLNATPHKSTISKEPSFKNSEHKETKFSSNSVLPIEDFSSDFDNVSTVYMPQKKYKYLLHSALYDKTSVPQIQESGVKHLYIGGLLELTVNSHISDVGLETVDLAEGSSILEAAELALKHINEQNYIPGYKLYMFYNDSKCDPGVGADAFYDLVYRKPQLVMMVGGACSEVTATLAEISPFWNLVLVSYGALSPILSDRSKYPTFYRLAATDSSHHAARMHFIRNFGWTKVAVLNQAEKMFTLPVNEMADVFTKANISIMETLTFRRDKHDLNPKMKELKESDARIIVGKFRESSARQVMCQAYQRGLWGPRFVWLLPGWYSSKWWLKGKPNETSCTQAELSRAVDGYFMLHGLDALSRGMRAISGLNFEEFLKQFNRGGRAVRSPHATLMYDTLWTVAQSLRLSMHKDQSHQVNFQSFTYNGEEKENLTQIIRNIKFLGMSGPVSFDGPDRQGLSIVEQNQGGNIVRVAVYYHSNDTLDFSCSDCKSISWKGGEIPVDSLTIIPQKDTVKPVAFYSVFCVSVVGIVLAAVFLMFNLAHRQTKYIKLSSPKLNNVAVVGCMLVYMSVILLGFDDATLPEEVYQVLCTGRAFLFAAGFSLAFGAMFAKTYRVHQIFRKLNRGLIKNKLLRDKQLLLIIGVLLLVDSALFLTWGLVDPMDRKEYNLTLVPYDEASDVLILPQLTKCHSKHQEKWMGVIYAYKGLLLIFGVYMAWETRHVKIPVLNDSQYIGMNVYNVVLMSIIVVAVSTLLSDRPTLSYVVVSTFVLISTTGMLCLLFLPKVYAILRHNGDPVITSSGLTVSANTRRFATNEKQEEFYRAEVQNRVYKRQIIELDQEIKRLEQLLQPIENRRMSDEVMYGNNSANLQDHLSSSTLNCTKTEVENLKRYAVTSTSNNCLWDSVSQGKKTIKFADNLGTTLHLSRNIEYATEKHDIPDDKEPFIHNRAPNKKENKTTSSDSSLENLLQDNTKDTRDPELNNESLLVDVHVPVSSPTPENSLNVDKQKRMTILQRELKRIKEELRSLGKVEMEVSQV